MVVVSLYLFCYKFYTRVDTFPERDFREKEKKKKKITSREIYVTFENNFWKYFPVEKKKKKKDKIKYLKGAMQM